MGRPHVLMRVFWPLDASRREDQGLIIGWRNSERDIMVVAILHDIDVSTHFRGYSELADPVGDVYRKAELRGS